MKEKEKVVTNHEQAGEAGGAGGRWETWKVEGPPKKWDQSYLPMKPGKGKKS